MGQAFQNQQQQNQELAKELEEKEKESKELANLVTTKAEVIKNLEKSLVDAKKIIAELKAQVQNLQRRDQATETDHPTEQQQQQRDATRVSTQSLANIHECYDQVLEVMQENRCSMACAFRLASCRRSTLRDFVAIAELKKVDEES